MTAFLNNDDIEIKDIRNGKRNGFSRIYEQLFSPLYSFGLKYVKDTIQLEDFVQEAFVSFWKKRADFMNLISIKSFLYTSVRNSCLNYLKHQNVKRKNEKDLIYKLETDHYFQNAIIEEETFNKLYTEIKNLPASTQQIMLLALNGLKNPEIAEELGVSVNTVKTLKKNAYSKLRHKLSPEMQSFIFFFFF
jgi:RNA polymerase sigma-70 factor (family 1)